VNAAVGKRDANFGAGKENETEVGGVNINPFYLSSDGKLWLQFGAPHNNPVFGPFDTRRI
jgi:hypothetical protein